ncbi:hypothetical protein EJ05DRAFT_472160 [Pseudovirgaria hyperparasitica]|uniref:Uncharacterized protein n=1 Tax=Pseudovirgaria hyperparasitica TaxID=470096 RepID=A0A6A6WM59_9PEZI|nr:uncharacterized protein EJ05DRAFT_472160 [Pseudovirgaria hyperparasitica]KAF2763243.1 hypothetical protein EJ05DRAFT_472160 [Pseudovirgaria hyperparasitica]
MKPVFTVGLIALAQLATAVQDPLITHAPRLIPRQNDGELVGYVSTSGASEVITPAQQCDPTATLTSSGAYATCCPTSGSCNFFTSCSDGNLLAASTNVYCDQGYCNTGVIVPTAGASDGLSYLACWATEYGTDPFALVQTPGDAMATNSGDNDSSENGSPMSTRGTTTRASSSVSDSAAPSSTSGGAAAYVGSDALSGGVLGVFAMVFGML